MKQQVNFVNELPKRMPDLVSVEMMLRYAVLFIVILFIFYGIGIWKTIHQAGELNELKAQEQQLIDEIDTLEKKFPEAADTKTLETSIANLQKQVAKSEQVLKEINQQQAASVVGFSTYLKVLSEQTPADVWLKQIQITAGGQGVLLSGSTLSSSAVAQMMKNLSEQEVFKDKPFEVIQMSKASGGTASQTESPEVINFTISTQVQQAKER